MLPMSRELGPGDYYFEDVEVGSVFRTGGLVITESHIVQFAGLSGDFFDLHMDDEFARAQGFPARVAHGLLVLALADGLKNRASANILAVASLGWRLDFKAPVFAGDRISAEIEIKAKRLSSKGRGLVTLGFTVRKQTGEVVQVGETTLVTRRRQDEAGDNAGGDDA